MVNSPVTRFLNVDTGFLIVARLDDKHNLLGAQGRGVKFDMVEMDFVRVIDKGTEEYYSIVGISDCGESVILELQ